MITHFHLRLRTVRQTSEEKVSRLALRSTLCWTGSVESGDKHITEKDRPPINEILWTRPGRPVVGDTKYRERFLW